VTAVLKSELVEKIAQANPRLFQRDAERIVSAVIDEIAAALASRDRVELRGFGSFGVKHRNAHRGRNPRTGASVPVTDKYLPFFKMSREMLERLNREKSALASTSETDKR
jgi:integration host factor subunit beta